MRPPSFWNFVGSRRNSTSSETSSFASSQPATSAKVIVLFDSSSIFALLLPKLNAPPRPPPCIWRMKKIHTPISSSIGNHEMNTCARNDCSSSCLLSTANVVLEEIAHHPQVVRAVGDELLLVGGGGPDDLAALDLRRLDAARAHLVHELGIRDRVARRLPRVELLDHGQHHEPDHEPDADVLEQIVQMSLLAASRGRRGPLLLVRALAANGFSEPLILTFMTLGATGGRRGRRGKATFARKTSTTRRF